MLQFGGKAKKYSSDSKSHFTVVMNNKDNGLYVAKKQKQKGYPFELRFYLTKSIIPSDLIKKYGKNLKKIWVKHYIIMVKNGNGMSLQKM